MIDKEKTLESFLDALDRIEVRESQESITLVLKDGRKIKCELKVPDPGVEIALRIIRGDKKD